MDRVKSKVGQSGAPTPPLHRFIIGWLFAGWLVLSWLFHDSWLWLQCDLHAKAPEGRIPAKPTHSNYTLALDRPQKSRSHTLNLPRFARQGLHDQFRPPHPQQSLCNNP